MVTPEKRGKGTTRRGSWNALDITPIFYILCQGWIFCIIFVLLLFLKHAYIFHMIFLWYILQLTHILTSRLLLFTIWKIFLKKWSSKKEQNVRNNNENKLQDWHLWNPDSFIQLFFFNFFFNFLMLFLSAYILFMYVCMYGCVGSSFLCEGFL